MRARGGELASLIKRVQMKLVAEGYDPGPIDGAMGAKTHSALRKYQAAKGLPVTGNIDAKTLSAMRIVPAQ